MTRATQFKTIGKKGGDKVAQMYDEEFFQQRSSKGGRACLLRYGSDFYRAIRMRRKSGK